MDDLKLGVVDSKFTNNIHSIFSLDTSKNRTRNTVVFMNKKCPFLSFETRHNIDVKNTHTKYENLGPEDKIVLSWSCMIGHSLFDLAVKVQDHSHFVLICDTLPCSNTCTYTI